MRINVALKKALLKRSQIIQEWTSLKSIVQVQ